MTDKRVVTPLEARAEAFLTERDSGRNQGLFTALTVSLESAKNESRIDQEQLLSALMGFRPEAGKKDFEAAEKLLWSMKRDEVNSPLLLIRSPQDGILPIMITRGQLDNYLIRENAATDDFGLDMKSPKELADLTARLPLRKDEAIIHPNALLLINQGEASWLEIADLLVNKAAPYLPPKAAVLLQSGFDLGREMAKIALLQMCWQKALMPEKINPDLSMAENILILKLPFSLRNGLLGLSSDPGCQRQFHSEANKLLHSLAQEAIGGLVFLIRHQSGMILPLFYPQIKPQEAEAFTVSFYAPPQAEAELVVNKAKAVFFSAGQVQPENTFPGIIAIGSHPETNNCLQMAFVKNPATELSSNFWRLVKQIV